MKNKTDQRSKFTQSLVKTALINLLNEKNIKDITVAELCTKANICRGTFYNQFYDVYDVYECLETEFFDAIAEKLDSCKTYSMALSFFREITYYIVRNVDWFKIVFRHMENNAFIGRVVTYIRDKYVSEYTERFPNMPEEYIRSAFAYTTNGSIALLADWILSDAPKPPESVADLIDLLNSTLTKGLFEKSENK